MPRALARSLAPAGEENSTSAVAAPQPTPLPKLIRAVAAAHPCLAEDAAALTPDIIARSPTPFPT
ncbi:MULTISPECIES: hypothetical protein [unclassified Streptomyces]|uniref:hypothetical protein n=1 Tax=unclassified Streptomyces TaxID=2593676 RepID=UPI0016555EC5|nr:hypothetical protein [Streptomyces sp. CB02980]MCB8900902.1 hypothetical protein [Streptomyces sp. CB02980]